MKRKKLLAAALALLLTLSLAPAALATELPFPAEWFSNIGGFSLRSLIDENRDGIEMAGSVFPLENALFLEECVVDEEAEFCVCETTENAVVLDENTLPAGMRTELRKEKVRIPDAKTGVEIAEEIRLEKAGRKPEPKNEEIDPADRDRETYYLYLVGTPRQTGESIFVLWDGQLRLVSVKVLAERPAQEWVETTEEPTQEWVEVTEAPTQEWVEPTETPVQAWGDTDIFSQDWTDTSVPMELPANPEPVIPTLPTPSVVVTGADVVRQGESAVLEARATNTYNPSYQWYQWDDAGQAWQILSGATDSRYSPDTTQAGDRAYLCEVTNNGSYGQTEIAYSDPVIVRVEAKQELPIPTVSISGGGKVEQGSTAVLEAQVSNAFNTGYQWYENTAPISGATGSQYRLDTSRAGTQTYVCEVTSSANGQTVTAYSDPVIVTVEARPTLPTPTVTVSGSTTVYVGDNAVLEAQVRDDYNARFQWYAGQDAINGATGRQYKPDTSRPGTWTYACVVTNSGYGQETYGYSESVAFTVKAPALDTPTVTIAGDARASVGDRAVLEARVRGGSGSISYQWYIGLGNYWAPIDDRSGKSAQYLPDTSKAGDYAYYCEVTCSDSYGQSVKAASEPVSFTVAEKTPVNRQVSAVSVYTQPKKVRYTDGEALDTTGLQLRVQYTDGGQDIIDKGFLATPQTISYNYSNNGVVTVNVNYKGASTSYRVNVLTQQQSLAQMVSYIAIASMPNRTSYTVGDYLDTTGLKIRVYSAQNRNDYLDIGEGFECSPTRLNSTGNQTITVRFAGKECYFNVAVSEATRVYGMTIQSLPANRSYAVGDTINPSGLVLQVQTNSGTQTVTNGYTITPRVATAAGTQTVTVLYDGMSTTYTIDVRSAEPPRQTPAPTPTLPPYGTVTPTPLPYATSSASPLPYGTVTLTPTPSTRPSAAPSVRPTPVPARTNTGVSTLVKVLFGVAVLALGGLIGYVLYLRKTGYDEEDYGASEPSPSEKLHDLFKKKK